jgi:hypothetical protein
MLVLKSEAWTHPSDGEKVRAGKTSKKGGKKAGRSRLLNGTGTVVPAARKRHEEKVHKVVGMSSESGEDQGGIAAIRCCISKGSRSSNSSTSSKMWPSSRRCCNSSGLRGSCGTRHSSLQTDVCRKLKR